MLNLFSRCLGFVLQFLTCIIKKRCSVRLAWTYTYCLCSLAACEQELLLNVRPPSRRLLRLLHLPFLLRCRRKLSSWFVQKKKNKPTKKTKMMMLLNKILLQMKISSSSFLHDPFRRHRGLRRLLLLFCFGFDIIITAASVRRIFTRSNFLREWKSSSGWGFPCRGF